MISTDSISVYRPSPFIDKFKTGMGLIVAGLSCGPVKLLKITAIALSKLGCWGQKFASRLKRFEKKINAVLIVHNLCNLSSHKKLTVLVPLKNIASRQVLWSERAKVLAGKYFQSLEATPLFKERFPTAQGFQTEQVQKALSKSVRVDGICFGASLELIKEILSHPIDSQEHLVNVVAKFRDGFSQVSAALQNIQSVFPRDNCDVNEEIILLVERLFEQEREKFKQQIVTMINDLKQKGELEKTELAVAFERIKSDVAIKRSEIEESLDKLSEYLDKAEDVRYLAPLVGLSLHLLEIEKSGDFSFPDIYRSVRAQERFNNLESGCYQVRFNTGPDVGHSIVYYRNTFGSYLIDPNFGLIPCDSSTPFKTLKVLLTSYKGFVKSSNEETSHFDVFPYALPA